MGFQGGARGLEVPGKPARPGQPIEDAGFPCPITQYLGLCQCLAERRNHLVRGGAFGRRQRRLVLSLVDGQDGVSREAGIPVRLQHLACLRQFSRLQADPRQPMPPHERGVEVGWTSWRRVVQCLVQVTACRFQVAHDGTGIALACADSGQGGEPRLPSVLERLFEGVSGLPVFPQLVGDFAEATVEFGKLQVVFSGDVDQPSQRAIRGDGVRIADSPLESTVEVGPGPVQQPRLDEMVCHVRRLDRRASKELPLEQRRRLHVQRFPGFLGQGCQDRVAERRMPKRDERLALEI